MATWEPDIDPFDRDEIGEEDYRWDDTFTNELETRLNKLRRFNKTLDESHDENLIDITMKTKNALKNDTIELIANEIYDKLTKLFNDRRKRLGIKGGTPIVEPIRDYSKFKLKTDGTLSYKYKKTVIYLGNIDKGLKSLTEMSKLGVNRLRTMGFTNITYEDIQPYKPKFRNARDEARILNEKLNERSKTLESSSTTDVEAIELMEMTSKDIDGLEQETSFIEPTERDKLLPLRELQGLDKQIRTIKGSLKVAIAKRVELEDRIKHEENKLNEIQDPIYSDDQRKMVEDRIKKLGDELNERNEEINILKGEASKQINQIKESITQFLDKETGTLGERIRTLFKEQGITIVSILTAVGMAIGVLIEALLGAPSASASTPGGTSGGDKKGGAREWIKNKLKALSSLLGKLAAKAGAALPGIIGSIVAWLLNRAKEVVGWLSNNLWALITGVGVLIYTYFMTKTRRR